MDNSNKNALLMALALQAAKLCINQLEESDCVLVKNASPFELMHAALELIKQDLDAQIDAKQASEASHGPMRDNITNIKRDAPKTH